MLETRVWSLGWQILWSRKWQFTPVFLPGKFHGQRSLMGYSSWGHKESDMTEQVSTCECIKDLLPRADVTGSAVHWKKPAILHGPAITLGMKGVLVALHPLFRQRPCALRFCQHDYSLWHGLFPAAPLFYEGHSAEMHTYVHELGHTSTVCGNCCCC